VLSEIVERKLSSRLPRCRWCFGLDLRWCFVDTSGSLNGSISNSLLLSASAVADELAKLWVEAVPVAEATVFADALLEPARLGGCWLSRLGDFWSSFAAPSRLLRLEGLSLQRLSTEVVVFCEDEEVEGCKAVDCCEAVDSDDFCLVKGSCDFCEDVDAIEDCRSGRPRLQFTKAPLFGGDKGTMGKSLAPP